MKLKDFIKRFVLSADINSFQGVEEKKKSILLNLFFYFYFLVVFVFFIYDIAIFNVTFFAANILSLIVGIVLYYLYQVKKVLQKVAVVFIITIASFLTFINFTGGINGTGIIFSLLLPLPTILLLGRKWGFVTLLSFLLFTVFGFFVFSNAPWFPDYSNALISRVSIVFLIISVIGYANEFVFEVLYIRLEKLSELLKVSQQRYKNMAVNKERFVSLVSHNLGDHIGSFAGIANLLDEEYDELAEQKRRELIRSLANISQQNFRLLHDLMKWSTVQSDVIPFLPKSVKLEKIYRDVIQLFNPLIEDKKLSFFLKMRSNSEIFADADMVSAIMRSLVSNAIKFSYVGGEVKIFAEEDDDKMVVTVSDNGVGMSNQDLMWVNASVSFSMPGTLEESGTGIGLILVKEFLQKNHGSFHVESKKGEGTKVVFRLPLVE